ncbi:unnamed protein product [Pleuronectes platessa]|uniref:Uncharacterized protein n=1 Tax=Pleuronectes platessa TaxID=8262 RepID=A0A9N7UIR3_PLEPL|nr:unnamed protein product [Pleuronectes platessa]
MDVGDERLKENVRSILRDHLVEIGVIDTKFQATVSPESGATAQSFSESALTFEQRKELLLLQRDRVADSRDLTDSERTLLLQWVLSGKAQEAYSALSIADKQYKNTVPSQIALYLNEHKVKTATEAAAQAEYVLTHLSYGEYRAPNGAGSQGEERKFRTAGVLQTSRWVRVEGVNGIVNHRNGALLSGIKGEQRVNQRPGRVVGEVWIGSLDKMPDLKETKKMRVSQIANGSIARANRRGERGHPCLVPRQRAKGGDLKPFVRIWAVGES